MRDEVPYRESGEHVRALFCFGLTQAFFDAPSDRLRPIGEALREAFGQLSKRFGVTVLGTIDDDATMVGATGTWPWTCYILAEVSDPDTVAAVCNQLRETWVGDDRLWRYVKIEARVGRPLFFGES
jgi:hypothetical protein